MKGSCNHLIFTENNYGYLKKKNKKNENLRMEFKLNSYLKVNILKFNELKD